MARKCYCSGCENQRRIVKREGRIIELLALIESFNTESWRIEAVQELRKLLKEARIL